MYAEGQWTTAESPIATAAAGGVSSECGRGLSSGGL